MKYFKVGVKCGHVGKNYYIFKELAIKSNNAKEAALIARHSPRVKHDQKDAISYVNEIEEVEFDNLILKNKNDIFFNVTNIQDYRINNANYKEEIKYDNLYEVDELDPLERKERIKYKSKKYKEYFNSFNYNYN